MISLRKVTDFVTFLRKNYLRGKEENMKALKRKRPPAGLSDFDIIYRILQGEKALYELLLRRHNQKLYRIVRAYLQEGNEIEDVMQNTYLKAYEKLHQFRQNASFSTWLIRIGINEALAKVKEQGKVRSIQQSSKISHSSLLPQMQNRRQLSPEEVMIQKETKYLIEKLIDLLDAKHKVVFIMKEIEGLSIREIADCLNLSPSNVKVRLHRAKATLKTKLFEVQLHQEGLFEFGYSKCDQLVESVMKRI